MYKIAYFLVSFILIFELFVTGVFAGGCICGANGGDRCNWETWPDGTEHLVCDNSDAGTAGACCTFCGNPCDTGSSGAAGCTAPQNVNCPAGQDVNYSSCSMSAVSPAVCSLGNAQYYEGNCNYSIPNPEDPENPICRQDEVVTCSCCAVGTEYGCTITDNGTYTKLNPPTTPYFCDSEGLDTFISYAPSNTVWRSYYYSDDPNCNNPSRCGELVTEYYVSTTCADKVRTCSCTPICSAGTAPTLVSPESGAIYSGPSGSASVDFSWSAPSSWGSQETGTNRSYTLCVGSSSTDPCTGGQTFTVGSGSTPATTTTQSITFGNKYWGVKATNMCGSSSVLSATRNICIEGYTLPGDAGVGNAYFSQWSACDPNTHKRTRTCREDCGTDNCAAAAASGLLEEDCLGEIRGTIFDATDLTSCPSFDPVTGYLIGVDTTLTANNRDFVINDQSTVPTHPWAPITTPETNSTGNYNVRVYAPANYSYDFSNLRDMYVVSDGPKLTCTSAVAVVPGNSTSCGTQPCSIVNNMSFGFERYWGGWWQVQGAGVHGELGLRTAIPSALPSEQSMILPDLGMGNRRGVASYGRSTTNMLGVNQNARVSASLWEALSSYGGTIYDYGYFNQQFKKFTVTTWNGVDPINYDDNGNGYQIFKVNGSINNFTYSPTGTQKVIFLVNGDVTVSGDIVVPDGAFLAILSSGSIEFGPLVTNADGWYLANRIYIRCVDSDLDNQCDRNDSQFVGNGSFVSWQGTYMNRDRGGSNNITGPAEKFNYRLDLYNNAPEPLKIVTKRYKPYVP